MRLGRRSRNEPSVRVRQLEAVAPAATPWRLPWPLMTVLAAVVTAAAGWILVTGFCVLGWISVPQIKASSVLQLGTQGIAIQHVNHIRTMGDVHGGCIGVAVYGNDFHA